jgi:hypothetical protein
MEKTVQLSNSAIELLNDLSVKYNITPSDVVCGLLIGFALNSLNEVPKVAQNQKKRVLLKIELSNDDKNELYSKNEKRFVKRYGCNFEYISRFGFSNYINEEVD